MRDFYKFLVAVFTAPDLRWQTAVYTGLGLAFALGLALPVLLPWTGFIALTLETLSVVVGVGGGLALIGYGGWVLVYGNRLQRFALEEVDEDESMEIEAAPASAPAPVAEEAKAARPRRPVGQTGLVCPICPKCRGPMMRGRARAGRAKGRDFWVCQRYPVCRGLRAIVGGRGKH